MAKEGNGNGVSTKIAWSAVSVVGFLIVAIFSFTFFQGNSLSERMAALDTKVALSDQKLEALTESVKALIESNKEVQANISELTISVNSCKDIKRKIRKTLNE